MSGFFYYFGTINRPGTNVLCGLILKDFTRSINGNYKICGFLKLLVIDLHKGITTNATFNDTK